MFGLDVIHRLNSQAIKEARNKKAKDLRKIRSEAQKIARRMRKSA